MKKALLIASFLLVTGTPAAIAQGCSMCTLTADNLDDKSAKGLNGGIIYLACLPLAILGTVSFMWWKQNKAS